MELLVVLLIIGILSTVALRTIDATRNRSLFDQTTAEMNKLVQAIVGNPDLAYDGRRVDFGYYGDMEELPPDLRDLLYNRTGSPVWRGPYIKLMSAGDTVSYLNDEWGHLYTYNPDEPGATIHSIGVNGLDMTVKVADDKAQLYDNKISGSFLDRDENPPGGAGNAFEVRLYYNNPVAHAGTTYAVVHPAPGGYYEIANTPSDPIWPRWQVPIGTKKLQAITPNESLTRYVTVAPRSHSVVDFKFTRAFAGQLQMIGQPMAYPDGSGFRINIASSSPDPVIIDWLVFRVAPPSAFMRDFKIDGNQGTNFPLQPGDAGIGVGDTVRFTSVTIGPELTDEVEVLFYDFHVDETQNSPLADVRGTTFEFRFSDGSVIEVPVP